MALSFVQRTDANGTGLTQTVAFTSNVATGNLLVLCVAGGDIGMVPSSITDTRSNSYTLRTNSTNNDGSSLVVWVYDCVSAGSGANTVSVTVNQDGGFLELTVWEFHSTAGTWTYDQGSTSFGTVNVATSGSVTTTQAAEVMIGYAEVFGTPGTYATGWTGTATASGNGSGYNIVSVIGSNAFTVTQGSANRYLGTIATYYVSVSGGTPVNGTVTIAGKAVSGLRGNGQRILRGTLNI